MDKYINITRVVLIVVILIAVLVGIFGCSNNVVAPQILSQDKVMKSPVAEFSFTLFQNYEGCDSGTCGESRTVATDSRIFEIGEEVVFVFQTLDSLFWDQQGNEYKTVGFMIFVNGYNTFFKLEAWNYAVDGFEQYDIKLLCSTNYNMIYGVRP